MRLWISNDNPPHRNTGLAGHRNNNLRPEDLAAAVLQAVAPAGVRPLPIWLSSSPGPIDSGIRQSETPYFQRGSAVIGRDKALVFFRQSAGLADAKSQYRGFRTTSAVALEEATTGCGAGHSVKAARTTTPCEVAN